MRRISAVLTLTAEKVMKKSSQPSFLKRSTRVISFKTTAMTAMPVKVHAIAWASVCLLSLKSTFVSNFGVGMMNLVHPEDSRCV